MIFRKSSWPGIIFCFQNWFRTLHVHHFVWHLPCQIFSHELLHVAPSHSTDIIKIIMIIMIINDHSPQSLRPFHHKSSFFSIGERMRLKNTVGPSLLYNWAINREKAQCKKYQKPKIGLSGVCPFCFFNSTRVLTFYFKAKSKQASINLNRKCCHTTFSPNNIMEASTIIEYRHDIIIIIF